MKLLIDSLTVKGKRRKEINPEFLYIFGNLVIGICVALWILLLIFGCSSYFWSTSCKEDSIKAAHFARFEGYPSRIVVGKSLSGYHAQAEALIDGKWQYIVEENGKVRIVTFLPFFEPYSWYSIETFRGMTNAR